MIFTLYAFAICSPAILTEFAHHDQYRYFRVNREDKKSCTEDTQFNGLRFDLGRPVTAYIECLVYRTTDTPADLRYFRAVASLLVACSMLVLSSWWLKAVPERGALWFFLPAAVVTLPGIQNLVLMANIPVLAAVLSSLSAYRLMEGGDGWARIVFAWLLVEAALFSYPMGAYAFFIPASMFVFLGIHRKPGGIWRRLARDIAFAGTASVAFYAVVRLAIHPMVAYRAAPADNYAFEAAFGIESRWRFWLEISRFASNLWNVYVGGRTGTAVLGAIGAAVILRAAAASREARPVVLSQIVCIPIFAALTTAPLMVSQMSEPLFRILIPYSALVCILLLWAFYPVIVRAMEAAAHMRTNPAGGALAAAAACLGVLFAFNVYQSACNSHDELQHLRSQLGPVQKSPSIVRILNVDRPQATRGMNGLRSMTDEFNVNTTVYSAEEIAWVVRTALRAQPPPANPRVTACADLQACRAAAAASPEDYFVMKAGDSADEAEEENVFTIDMRPFTTGAPAGAVSKVLP